MSKVIVGLSTSVDGIASGTSEEDFWPVHESVLGWLFNLRSWREAQGMEGGDDTDDSRLWHEEFQRVGAQIVGRRVFDFSVEAWGENPSFHAPVFIVTHRAHERIDKQGGTSYTFVTDGIAHAIENAKTAAQGKDVLIAGGLSIAQQALRAGLVDELSMHISPVLIGSGARLLDCISKEQVRLHPTRLTGSGAVTHVRYDIIRSA